MSKIQSKMQIFRDNDALSSSLNNFENGRISADAFKSRIYAPHTHSVLPLVFIPLLIGGFLLAVAAANYTDSIIVFFVTLVFYGAVVSVSWKSLMPAASEDKLKISLESIFDPKTMPRLQQAHGVYRVATDNLSTYGIPPVVTLITIGQFIGGLAESSNPVVLKRASEIAAAQKGGPITPANEFIDNFTADKTVYLVSENVMGHLTHPQQERGTEGLLILSTTHLYFFSQQQGAPLGINKNRHSQYVFDAGIIAALKRRFRDDSSFAIPLREIIGLMPVTIDEGSMKVPYLEVQQSNERKHWIKFSQPSLTGEMKEQAVLSIVVFWMERIQWVCAVEGTLLVGIESQRLTKYL